MRYRSEVKKQQILTAALKLFVQKGVKNSSMQAIAAAAEVATGTLYLYFPDKESLVLACAEAFHHRHRQAAQKILESHLAASEKLSRYVLHRFQTWKKLTGSSPALIDFVQATIEIATKATQSDTELWFTTVGQILQEGTCRGEFKITDIPNTTEVFLLSIMGFFPLPGIRHPNRPSKQQLLKLINWYLIQWRSS